MRNGFRLPFAVRFGDGPLLSAGAVVDLALRCHASPTDALQARMDRVVSLFARLGSMGFLAGATIVAERSGLDIVRADAGGDRTIRYRLENTRIDDRALNVLCDLLMGDEVVARSIESVMLGPAPSLALRFADDEVTDYPERNAMLPFVLVDDDPEGGGVLVRLEMADEACAALQVEVDALFSLWAQAILGGAYAVPPIPPTENYVEIGRVEYLGATVECWAGKLRAGDACLDALVNALVAVHARFPLRAFEITE